MEDRIEINGVWYVREDNTVPSKNKEEEFEFDIVHTKEAIIETDEFLITGTVLENQEDGTFSMPSVDIKFKNSDRDDEYWDNDLFLIGIATGDVKYLDMINEESELLKEAVITIAKRMLELGWI